MELCRSFSEQTLPAGIAVNDTEEQAHHAFLQHGRQSSAYFIYQRGVECFEGAAGGRVYYAQQDTPLGKVNLVFTNPFCQREDMASLLAEFERLHKWPTVYVSVDREVAQPLKELGYRVNQIGTESRISLASFSLRGKRKKHLRHASHFGERNACVVKELDWSQVDAAQVKAISHRWLKSKGVSARELQYATRPPVYDNEWRVRKFYCMRGDTLLAYVFFDPYFDNGELKGYCANILRANPDRSANGALDYTVLEAIKVFRAEGVKELSLGIAPLQNIEAEPGERKSVRLISKLFYEYGNNLYSFKGLAYHKSRYRPIETPWYLCSKDISLFRLYWGVLFGLKVLGGKEL